VIHLHTPALICFWTFAGSGATVALISGLPNVVLCREERILSKSLHKEEAKWQLSLFQCGSVLIFSYVILLSHPSWESYLEILKHPLRAGQTFFKFGLVLWLLAQEKYLTEAQEELCAIVGCQCLAGASYGEYPGAIVKLPLMDDCISAWYTHVIDACRSERPEERLPTSELLSLFPPIGWFIAPNYDASVVLMQPHSLSLGCDTCKSWESTFYHCKICKGGDLDLCLACSISGHCYIKGHFLELVFLRVDRQ